MPPHRRPHHGNEELLEEYSGGPKGTGVLRDGRQDTDKCRTEAQCGINTNIEERVLFGTGQAHVRQWSIKGLQAVDSMREVMRAR